MTAALVQKIASTVAQQKKKPKNLEGHPHAELMGKYLIVRKDYSAGDGFEKYLQDLDCDEVVSVESYDQIYAALRTQDIKTILFWYGPSEEESIGIIHNILETREFQRVGILIFAPSDDWVKAAKTKIHEWLVDGILKLPASRTEFERDLKKSVKLYQKTDSARSALEALRLPWQRALSQKSYKLASAEEFKEIIEPISKKKGKEFWLTSEVVAFQTLGKNYDSAKAYADKMIATYPDSLLAMLLWTTVDARINPKKPGISKLLQWIEKRELTLDQMYQIGKLFVRWKDCQALEKVLSLWYSREKINRESQFSYLVGSYYLLKDQIESAKPFLKYAASQEPGRWEYLEPLARCLGDTNDLLEAEKIWQSAQHVKGAVALTCKLGLIPIYYKQRKVRVADGLLDDLLKRFPKNKELQNLKKQYMDSRVA